MNFTPEIITSIIALLSAAFAIWRSFRTVKKEEKQLDSNIIASYEETLNKSNIRADKLADRVTTLEKEVDTLNNKVDILERELRIEKEENKKLREEKLKWQTELKHSM